MPSFDAETTPSDQLNSGPDLHRPEVQVLLQRYWRTNLRIMITLLATWFAAGLGCSVLLADLFNQFKLLGTGFPLGFWFAQQGSIIVFVLLILSYCVAMNRLDARHHQELEQIKKSGRAKT
jgi:putative solute:sodium symporter small subunit